MDNNSKTKNIRGVIIFVFILAVLFGIIRIADSFVHRPAVSESVPQEEDMEARIDRVYNQAQADVVASAGDPEFEKYVQNDLEKLCPFYEPDGITYRNCLADLVAKYEKEFTKGKTALKEIEDYCDKISEPYSAGVASIGLYLSCEAYKLSR